MVAPSIQIDGIKELNRQLRRVKDKGLDDELKAIHSAIADEVTQLALPRVPVVTGALKRSVRSSGTKAAAIGRAGKKSVPYAAAVHWKYGPPFLRDAAVKIERDIVDRYDKAVAGMLERTIGR